MKVLLVAINAKYIHSNPAVYDLRAYAKKHVQLPDLQIDVAEYTINEQLDTILMDIYQKRPDVLAFSVYIWNVSYVESLLPELHKLLPDVPLLLGGPEVSYHAPEVLKKFPFLTGIMVGEGEETFKEILMQGVKALPGLCLPGMREEEITVRSCISMDEVPFFYEEFGDEPNLGPFAHKILYYETSRGCPFRCSYCLSSIEKSIRLRSMDLVEKELQFFLDRKVPQVKFIDRTFNVNKEHAMAIWHYIKAHDNGITNFHFEIESSLLDEEELTLLSSLRPGLVQLEIGVQSTNEETLKAVHRKNDFAHLKECMKVLKNAHNMHLHLDLIAGLPYEDLNTFQKSFNDLFSLQPNELQLGFLKVLKGTQIEADTPRFGIISRNEAPYEVLQTNWLSFDDIIELKQVEEILEIYYNSHQFEQSLALVLPLFETPYDFFREFSAFFKKHGLFQVKSARITYYQALLDFIGDQPDLRESLALDFMARELPKKKYDFFPEGNCIDFKACALTLSSGTYTFHYAGQKDPISGNYSFDRQKK